MCTALQSGEEGEGGGAHHAVEQVQGPQADGLVLVVQALQDEVLVRLHRLGVRLQDLGHGQQPQVLHCRQAESGVTPAHPDQGAGAVGLVAGDETGHYPRSCLA